LALTPGTRLGEYEVIAQIGEGGMGQLYRARDTKLSRDVALKILPDAFASNPDRLARFTREAQTLASLNHPNIAHIHGLEESGGVRALVMELVEGQDLSQRIERGRSRSTRPSLSPSRSRHRTFHHADVFPAGHVDSFGDSAGQSVAPCPNCCCPGRRAAPGAYGRQLHVSRAESSATDVWAVTSPGYLKPSVPLAR
jgi:protein kinase-like protein